MRRPLHGLQASLLCAGLVLSCHAASAADILGIGFGDSPGLAYAKLETYGIVVDNMVVQPLTGYGGISRARQVLAESSDPAQLAEARKLIADSPIKVHETTDEGGHTATHYIKAEFRPSGAANPIGSESITVVFSGFASGNVAFKVQRYVTFSFGSVGVDALRTSMFHAVGTPTIDDSIAKRLVASKQTGDTRPTDDAEPPDDTDPPPTLRRMVYALDATGKPLPPEAKLDHAALLACAEAAEHIDLEELPDPPVATDVSACPAVLAMWIEPDRDAAAPDEQFALRFNEVLTDFPHITKLVSTESAAREASLTENQAAHAAFDEQLRKAATTARDAALHGPVSLKY